MENTVTISVKEYDALRRLHDKFDDELAEAKRGAYNKVESDFLDRYEHQAAEIGRLLQVERESVPKADYDRLLAVSDANAAKLTEATGKVETLERDLETLSAKRDELKESLDALVREHDDTVDDLEAERDKFERLCDELSGKRDDLLKLAKRFVRENIALRRRGLFARIFRKGE